MKKNSVNAIQFRAGTVNDGNICGKICFEAFKAIAEQHHFPSEFPQLDQTTNIISSMLANRGFYSVIGERNGKIVGSNFLDERGSIVGVGPISIDPTAQNTGIGRQLMQQVVDRAISKGQPGIRLNTAAHHGRSLSLYSKIGFKVQAPMVVLQGHAVHQTVPNTSVRTALPRDLDATSQLCEMVHGCNRKQEMTEAIAEGTAKIV